MPDFNRLSGIYCIENLIDHKKYIGQSKDILTRLRTHKSSLEKNKHPNTHLQRAWNKQFGQYFIFYVVCLSSVSDLNGLEIGYIHECKSNDSRFGYNKSDGGLNSVKGMRHSEESKLKMSISAKLRVKAFGSPMSGKHHTEKTKAHWSSIRKGRKLSDETKQKISTSNKGKRHLISVDQRNKASKALQGSVPKSKKSSKFTGVRYRAGKYEASITYNQTFYYLGRFDRESDAAQAYDNKAIELYGIKAKTNFKR